ncbi:hypothetical protein G5B38_05325 [Pseudohalocynthiibacter aestuariivivens]|uniref:Uncharacterized protein n=1 Tax=Roseovarius pelagicus TaxID=2980108 RepID=A0ABY6DAB2_9RHOB|nr:MULTISPECIES: hypothetical protein [Rhodobacterales]QIE44994.1 hypothetical protein G5B38_05325 [Pseudohalocynthiibacter aestuariivivens]UXX83087.1 hypothetical protein N7U68_18735 [Roseovarius pelagicus]
MLETQTYEIDVKSVDVTEAQNGSGSVRITYRGRDTEKTVTERFASSEFRDVFECCQGIARAIMESEFHPNSGVSFEFKLVDEEGISIWHTSPNNFLKMPLRMNMDWTCNHLQNNFKSYTTLGVVEVPEEFHLVEGRMPTPKLVELLMDSMISGLEFIGLMFLQREHMGQAHEDVQHTG